MSSLQKQFPNATMIDGEKQPSEQILDKLMESLTSNNNVTILTLPPKGSANDIEVKLWDQVNLTHEWQQKAIAAKIPYEMEWFVISNIQKDSDNNPISYNLTGSMGGGWKSVDWNQPNVIASIVGNMMS